MASDGPDALNLALSYARADAVRDYLVAHGVSSDRLVAEAFGETRPTSANNTRRGKEANRRVEFVIVETAPQP